MTVPSVNITELDGQLGILPPTSGLPMVVLAPCQSGPFNTPAAFAKKTDIIANFVGGMGVEAAAYMLAHVGKPVVMLRCNTTDAGEYTTLDTSDYTGSSVPTPSVSDLPADDYEFVITFTRGGTIADSGSDIRYKLSLDGGRTQSGEKKLGVATFIEAEPESGPLHVDFGVGDVNAGDVIRILCTGPVASASDVSDALDALAASALKWDGVLVGPLADATMFETVSGAIDAMHAAGKHHWAVCAFRNPDNDFAGGTPESEADYRTAFEAAFGSESGKSVVVCAGGTKTLSALTARKYRRPAHIAVASLASGVSEEVSLASITDVGALPGVSIRDANGNPDEHDETLNPGLDDDRALVLRTFESEEGVFVNRPNVLAPTGSDFSELPERRVMNIIRTTLDAYMVKRLHKTIRLNPKTGFILEEEARAIESEANALLAAAVLTKPKASSARLILSRTDNILSTRTLTGQARAVPLGRPEEINLDVGWVNPALRTS